MSAYACEPNKGSEPGVGWGMAQLMAKYHDVWVLTRANNYSAIQAHLDLHPSNTLHFVYFDLPSWLRWWKRGAKGVQLYYYLWQVGIYFIARRLQRTVPFDIVHHITFGRFWSPSLISLLPVPFIWGPVGGGESSPTAFWKTFGWKGVCYEVVRDCARWFGKHDPLVRLTAKQSVLALATTDETAEQLRKLGCRNVRTVTQCSIHKDLFRKLSTLPAQESQTVRFISIGRPLHWKGFSLAIKAFAASRLNNAEYWLILNGGDAQPLELLVETLGIQDRVRIIRRLPTLDAVYSALGECHVLIHPALHEAFGNVVLEGMAAGKPVICLDLGGPSTQVTQETGIKIPAHTTEQVVQELSAAMIKLAKDSTLRKQMRNAALDRVAFEYVADQVGQKLNSFYTEVRHSFHVKSQQSL